jgi:hypothetical protein
MAMVPGEIIGSHRIGEICAIYFICKIVKGNFARSPAVLG